MADAWKVWSPDNEDEDEAREVLAFDAADAATEYGDALARDGDCEATAGKTDVRMRNLATNELFEVEIYFEWEPRACTSDKPVKIEEPKGEP